MAYATTSIASRIEWCRLQSMQACAPLELEGWHAEEEGLRDALFNRNRMNQYQHCPPSVFVRYVIGLQDGHALMRTAAVVHIAQPPPNDRFDTSPMQGIDGAERGFSDISRFVLSEDE